jgi:MoxR-like ATPase
MRQNIERLKQNLGKTIVGKADAIRLVLVAVLSGGHALLEDVPGVGKTLLAKSLARSIDGKFQRIQCTPDLLPTDITGTNIWNPRSGEFEFLPGPVFANVLLADEINRATPRTQSALLDRFTLSLTLGYPAALEELQMLEGLSDSFAVEDLQPCISLEEVQELRRLCAGVKVEGSLKQYIVDLVRSTREDEEITLGVSPRGAVALHRASQALAFISGRDFATPDDVKELAPHVLSHRLIPAGGRRAKTIVDKLLRSVPIP